jgi:hypothetical protein
MEMAQVSIPFSKKEGDVLQMKPQRGTRKIAKVVLQVLAEASYQFPKHIINPFRAQTS